MANKFGIFVLLCVFGLWVSPGVGAAVCAEIMALLDGHRHAHVSTDSDHDHPHAHDACRADVDGCCVKIFVGGGAAFVSLSSSAKLVLPQITVAWRSSSKLIPHSILNPPKFFSFLSLQTRLPDHQRPLFVLSSAFLI